MLARMDEKTRTSLSKFLSLVLRHEPGAIGITLDGAGWTDVARLLEACQAHGKALSREALEELVATSPKRRFALSEDGQRIRASQGHSVEVELGYAPAVPPERLFHGTVAAALDSIRQQGLVRGERHHVHLSADEATARNVGARRGSPVVLGVRAGELHRAGHVFFRSENGVWLTEAVPPGALEFP
jgi:putative RNA 2'-phosphotransferase